MDAAPGCRLHRRSSINILTAWPGRLAQAPRVERVLPGPAHHIGAREVSENRTVGGPARARRRSELANRRSLYGGQLSSPPYSGRRFANFQRQRGPASPPISVFCADAPFKVKYVGRGGIHAIHVLCVQKERLRGPLCTVTVTKTTVTSQTHGDRAARAP